MGEQEYFEQFVGDILEIEIAYLPIPLREFEGFNELQRKQVMTIATTFKIPLAVWLGWHSD